MKRFSVEEYKYRLAESKKVKVKTVKGKDVKILTVDRKSAHPVVGLIKNDFDVEIICTWNKDGHRYPTEEDNLDLVFDVEKHEGWVKVYRVGNICYTSTCIYATREEALEDEGEGCVDVIKITWEE